MNQTKRISSLIPTSKHSPYTSQCVESKPYQTHKKSSTDTASSWKSSWITALDATLQALFLTDSRGSLIRYRDESSFKPVTASDSCVSCHPHKPYLAVSYQATIGIYNMNSNQWIESLLFNNAMQEGIYSLAWCHDSDALLVGTSEGIACWRLYALAENNSEQSWMQFYYHPRRRPVHIVEVSSQGRIFAAMTKGESLIYLWDSALVTYAPLYCFDGSGGSIIKWSPNGSGIVACDETGGLSRVDTYTWHHNACCSLPKSIENICWITDKYCLFVPMFSKSIYSFEILLSEEQDANGSSIQLEPMPLELDTSAFDQGDNLVICDMKSEDREGRFIAITFKTCPTSSNNVGSPFSNEIKSSILPLVAVYMVHMKPTLSLSVVRVIGPVISYHFGVNLAYVADRSQNGIVPINFTFGLSQETASSQPSQRRSPKPPVDDDWIVVGNGTEYTGDETALYSCELSSSRSVTVTNVIVSWSSGSMTIDSLSS